MHPPATDEQDTIPTPAGYPIADRWADPDIRGAEWIFAVPGVLREHYAAIAEDDPRIQRTARANLIAGERALHPTIGRHICNRFPEVFTPLTMSESSVMRDVARPDYMQVTEYRVGPGLQLHEERKRIAAELWATEKQIAEYAKRDAAMRPCPQCSEAYLPSTTGFGPTDVCPACNTVRTGIARAFGPHALDVIDDKGTTRLAAALGLA